MSWRICEDCIKYGNCLVATWGVYPHLKLTCRAKETKMSNEKNKPYSEKQMGHFTDWKFGVPVKVHSVERMITEGRLFFESDIEFKTVARHGAITRWNKARYHYELIPYEIDGCTKQRFPVCQSPSDTAYCNRFNNIAKICDCTNDNIIRIPNHTAILTIDDKKIELSHETITNLIEQIKELGV